MVWVPGLTELMIKLPLIELIPKRNISNGVYVIATPIVCKKHMKSVLVPSPLFLPTQSGVLFSNARVRSATTQARIPCMNNHVQVRRVRVPNGLYGKVIPINILAPIKTIDTRTYVSQKYSVLKRKNEIAPRMHAGAATNRAEIKRREQDIFYIQPTAQRQGQDPCRALAELRVTTKPAARHGVRVQAPVRLALHYTCAFTGS